MVFFIYTTDIINYDNAEKHTNDIDPVEFADDLKLDLNGKEESNFVAAADNVANHDDIDSDAILDFDETKLVKPLVENDKSYVVNNNYMSIMKEALGSPPNNDFEDDFEDDFIEPGYYSPPLPPPHRPPPRPPTPPPS